MFFTNAFRKEHGVSPGLILLLGSLSYLIVGFSMPHPQTSLKQGGVTFELRAPRARKVAVVGDFNKWDPAADILDGPDANGVWRKTIILPRGRHEYLFLVDGKTWLPDSAAPSSEDGMGGRNSIITVN